MGAKITTLKNSLLIDKPKILKKTTIATKPYQVFQLITSSIYGSYDTS